MHSVPNRHWLSAILAWLLIGSLPAGSATAADMSVPDFAGSASCAGCHQDIATDWSASDHALAWTLPSESTVAGDFNDAVFEHAGVISRFRRDGADYLIETTGADGQKATFKVVGVAGVAPLQQYLLSPKPGRTQAFDVAWDTEGKRWYQLTPGEVASAGNGFHWTGPYKNWEARCAECHATGYSRNYDATALNYAPLMAEIGVGCEGCHGPASDHLRWAADPAVWPSPTMGLFAAPFADAASEIQLCSTCHSRREAYLDGNPLPGTPFHDSYGLALLRPGLYEPGGIMQDEVYNTGSFLQSKMYAKGVRCSNCHEPHSGDLRAEGNAVCAQCHSPAGNPEFPSLTKADYDTPAHTFHAEGSAGAECKACHLPARTYMGVDTRHDHGFRIPRPDLAADGMSDACTDCHQDRNPAWAVATLESWFPASTHRGPHYASILAAGRADPAASFENLAGLATGADAAIVRASALELLAPVVDPGNAARFAPLLADPDPLIRAAAAGAMRTLPEDQRLAALMPLLGDPLRAVRIAAARALVDTGAAAQAPAGTALAAALGEWQSALSVNLDFPETHLQIGGIGLTTRDFAMARAAFAEAAALDPQLVDAWYMIIQIDLALGDQTSAQTALAAALAANPGNPDLLQLR